MLLRKVKNKDLKNQSTSSEISCKVSRLITCIKIGLVVCSKRIFVVIFISIYIKLKVCLSVCLSAIERKLETFRYKQTYESYITFSREAKYGILISIRIVYGGLRAYIYSTVAKCATNSCHKINYYIFVNFVSIVIAFQ